VGNYLKTISVLVIQWLLFVSQSTLQSKLLPNGFSNYPCLHGFYYYFAESVSVAIRTTSLKTAKFNLCSLSQSFVCHSLI